jgi:hypothetical protein
VGTLFVAVAIVGVAGSVAVAATSPKDNRSAKPSSPPALPGPWPQRIVARTDFTDTPVVGPEPTTAYGIGPAGAGQHVYGRLMGINLVTGKTERGPLVFLSNSELVASADEIWLAETVTEAVGPTEDLVGATPSQWTLHRIAAPTTRLEAGHYLQAFAHTATAPQLVPANDTSEDLWGTSGNRLELIDPTTGRVIRTISAPPRETLGVLASPSGSLLYVSGWTSENGRLGVFELDAASGRVLAQAPVEPGSISVIPVATTANDVWIDWSGGMSTHFLTEYRSSPFQAIRAAPSSEQTRDDTGLYGYSIEVFGGTGFVAIPGEISCVSPTTGKVRASASIPASDGDSRTVTPFAVIGRTLYVVQSRYTGPGSGSVLAVSPPPACFTAG